MVVFGVGVNTVGAVSLINCCEESLMLLGFLISSACNFSDSFGLLKTNAPGVGVGLPAFCPKMDSNCPGTAATAPGLGTAGTGIPAPPGTPFNGNRESTTGVNGVSGNNAVSEGPMALLKALKPNGLFCEEKGCLASGSIGPTLGAGGAGWLS